MDRLTRKLSAAVARALPVDVDTDSFQRVHGGSISGAWKVSTSAGPLFIKAGSANQAAMFAAEAAGLDELRRAAAVRVPAVRALHADSECALLALDWLDLDAGHACCDAAFGERLARLHRSTTTHFGWHRDNTIGSTRQCNAWSSAWGGFLREHRLGFQLDLAADSPANRRMVDRGRQLCECLDEFFVGYEPVPSLLHGDLWSGNRACLRNGEPVMFDPAVYYGDREADLAMTRLFGGFGRDFYAAYSSAWPLDVGAAARIDLYNLYHVLNHLHLFGGNYRVQAESMIERLLAQVGR